MATRSNDDRRPDPKGDSSGLASPATGEASGAAVVELRRLAHARTGDKGNRSSISVIAYRPEFWDTLVEQVTEDAVRALFAHRRPTSIVRYLLPRIGAMNFVIDDALDGGVNDSLNLDTHGKSLSFLLLTLPVRIPPEFSDRLAGRAVRRDD